MKFPRHLQSLKALAEKEKFLQPDFLQLMWTSPSFLYELSLVVRSFSDEDKHIMENLKTLTPALHTPFNNFVLFDPGSDYTFAFCRVTAPKSKIVLDAWIVAFDLNVVSTCGCPQKHQFASHPKGVLVLKVVPCDCGKPDCCKFATECVSVHFKSNLKHWEHFTGAEMEEELKKSIWGTITRAFQHFLVDVMHPSNTVLKISPKCGPSKSVHWQLARTHYVILNTKQARLCQSKARGPSDQQIIRAAHWRRAHFRRLYSDKFRSKRGALVPVRHAWVGPKEWVGTDSKIYKVVELNNNPPTP